MNFLYLAKNLLKFADNTFEIMSASSSDFSNVKNFLNICYISVFFHISRDFYVIHDKLLVRNNLWHKFFVIVFAADKSVEKR